MKAGITGKGFRVTFIDKLQRMQMPNVTLGSHTIKLVKVYIMYYFELSENTQCR
jgi:hypothetical protein